MKKDLDLALWKLLYLFSIGLYTTVGGLLSMLFVLQQSFGYWKANFFAFAVVIFARALYEAIVLHGAHWKSVEIKRFCKFALTSACILVPILFILKKPLGDWAVLVTIVISSRITKKLRARYFPVSSQKNVDPLRTAFEERLPIYIKCLYAMFVVLALLSYIGLSVFGKESFFFVFGTALFISLILDMYLEWRRVYEKTIDVACMLFFCCIGIGFSILGVAWVFSFMMLLGGSGKASTISGVIFIKLIQPVVFKKVLERAV
jgi:hypothetical protein